MIHLPPLLQRTFPTDSFNSRLKPLTRRAYVTAFMLPNKRTSRFIAPFSTPQVPTEGAYCRARTGPSGKIPPKKYLQPGQNRAEYLQPGQNRARKIPPTGPNSGHRKIPPTRPKSGQKNTSNRAKYGPYSGQNRYFKQLFWNSAPKTRLTVSA